MNESQRAMVGVAVERIYAEEAKKRQLAGVENLKKGEVSPVKANLPQPEAKQENRQAREQAASVVHVSPRSIQTALYQIERSISN